MTELIRPALYGARHRGRRADRRAARLAAPVREPERRERPDAGARIDGGRGSRSASRPTRSVGTALPPLRPGRPGRDPRRRCLWRLPRLELQRAAAAAPGPARGGRQADPRPVARGSRTHPVMQPSRRSIGSAWRAAGARSLSRPPRALARGDRPGRRPAVSRPGPGQRVYDTADVFDPATIAAAEATIEGIEAPDRGRGRRLQPGRRRRRERATRPNRMPRR